MDNKVKQLQKCLTELIETFPDEKPLEKEMVSSMKNLLELSRRWEEENPMEKEMMEILYDFCLQVDVTRQQLYVETSASPDEIEHAIFDDVISLHGRGNLRYRKAGKQISEKKGDITFYTDDDYTEYQQIKDGELFPVVSGKMLYVTLKKNGKYKLKYNLNGCHGFSIFHGKEYLKNNFWVLSEAEAYFQSISEMEKEKGERK